MKLIIEQYGRAIIVVIVCGFFFMAVPLLFNKSSNMVEEDRNQNLISNQFTVDDLPVLHVTSLPIPLNSVFDYRDYILTAMDQYGNDLKNEVTFKGDVDTSLPGGYDCQFMVKDQYGLTTSVKCSFVVE